LKSFPIISHIAISTLILQRAVEFFAPTLPPSYMMVILWDLDFHYIITLYHTKNKKKGDICIIYPRGNLLNPLSLLKPPLAFTCICRYKLLLQFAVTATCCVAAVEPMC
jgi:hypothetical protein